MLTIRQCRRKLRFYKSNRRYKTKAKLRQIHNRCRMTEPCDFNAAISDNIYRGGAEPPVVKTDKALVDNNLVQGASSESTGKITVEGKDSRITHNTIEGVKDAEIRGTGDHETVDNNLIRGPREQ